MFTVIKSSDTNVAPYIKLTTKGIDPGSILIYKTYNASAGEG